MSNIIIVSSKKGVNTYLSIFFLIGLLLSCTKNKDRLQQDNPLSLIELKETPMFNEDSAYSFIEKQLSFGARVPNSIAHQTCGQYLEAKLNTYGAKVTIQNFEDAAYNGTLLKGKNIIASFNEKASKRLLLCAHWDTRHVADKDEHYLESESPQITLLGANDGASGVAVLLEIARIISLNEVELQNLGIDIILFDLEDYGSPDTGEGYCLGSQYWAANKHEENYSAYYGILLDMVAGKDSKFVYEEISYKYGKTILKKIWSIGIPSATI